MRPIHRQDSIDIEVEAETSVNGAPALHVKRVPILRYNEKWVSIMHTAATSTRMKSDLRSGERIDTDSWSDVLYWMDRFVSERKIKPDF